MGQKDGGQIDGDESTGHEMGRHILELKDKKRDQLTDDDEKRMRKVIGYVHRHLPQRPNGDVHDTRWRYSLMSWGHDPEKWKSCRTGNRSSRSARGWATLGR